MRCRLAIALLAATGLLACAPAPTRPTGPVEVKILAINDFHGNLRPPQGGIRIRDPQDAEQDGQRAPPAAPSIWPPRSHELRAKNPNHIFVAAGDLVGASPLVSALFHDEPTVEALGLMGLEASAVGNHEFDHGSAELLRLQRGGCHPTDGCKGPQPFAGAKFQLPGRQHHRHAQRPDAAAGLSRQALPGHPGGLHRPDAEGHAADRGAGRRGRAAVSRRGADGQRAGARAASARASRPSSC